MVCAFASLALLLVASNASNAQSAPNLGSVGTYGAFTGAGAITNTGLTVVNGDIGTHVGSFTGFPPGIYTGAKHVADASSLAAKNDLILAYNSLNDATHAVMFDTALGSGMGNGQVLTPRTYGRGDLTTLAGNLTFDAKGNPGAIFIIKIRAALNVSANTQIILANRAQAANIYWAVDGAVSILDNSVFKGTILSNGAIHFYGGSSLEGRALATTGAVTLASNVMNIPVTAPADRLEVITPAAGDSVRGGTQNYQITWSGTGIGSNKTLDYSLDSGATWRTIGTTTTSAFSYAWNVPDTVSKKALVRVTDQNNLRDTSGLFTIYSSKVPAIVVVRPALGEIVTGGSASRISWTGSGIGSTKTFEYSLDSGATWKSIGTATTDSLNYGWSVPDIASTKAMVRITDQNNLRGVSGIFTIVPSTAPASVIVVRPALGEVIEGGTGNYRITWTGSGIAPGKSIEYSLDSGATWRSIATITSDGFSHEWSVPDTASTRALVRVTDSSGVRGVSGLFSIIRKTAPGSIIVVRPAAGEVIEGGMQNYLITFTGTNVASQKTIEYSLDGGLNWYWLDSYSSESMTRTWVLVPNVATTNALLRIRDGNGVTGTSGMFTITETPGAGSLNSVTLSGLDSYRNIENGKQLGISWTYTPDIGTFVAVEYSTDGMMTWNQISNVQVSDAPNTIWMTPPGGNYGPVYIRVTSSKGMTVTSLPFTISSPVIAGIGSDVSVNGYSISSYPNPVSGQATIHFVLPVSSDVILTIVDGLGNAVGSLIAERFEAGSHNVSFDASNLTPGAYSYMLQADSVKFVGRISVVR